jgi:NAD(P)-dependent dehydrogenase (short-subunit alcohol dehydrogenase family)
MAQRPVALITGGSRGIGAATALALARRGFDVALTYHNKQARAAEVAALAQREGARTLIVGGDITDAADRDRLAAALARWSDHLDVLVLNASGGLERDRLAADPDFPFRINRDAQTALVDLLLPRLRPGGTIVFVTSHWAHLYGRVAQLPGYEPVAASKHAGEQALRARVPEFADVRVRLIVVSGDLVEGTITPRLLERRAHGLSAERRSQTGPLPTTEDMAAAIVRAATDSALSTGTTLVVGGALDALLAAGAGDLD